MFAFLRNKGRVEYATPPVGGVDEARIAQIDERTFIAFREGDRELADRLIDLRNAIRPARPAPVVPVIPGRTT